MTELDWDRLQRLRDRFLATTDAPRRIPDYWLEPDDLEVYDQVLAQRIGWKWDAVLAELATTEFASRPSGYQILDWGCGTGIAARRFVHHFGADTILLHDRSAAAMDFAAARLGQQAPELQVRRLTHDETPDLLLLSHVLGELDATAERQLLGLIERCPRVLWVEAGTRPIARRLSAIRDTLLHRFAVLAPCPHQADCSALRSGTQHWCHSFARPPAEVFMDATWAKVSHELRIDLRSLPYHFLALVQHGEIAAELPVVPRARLIGRAEIRNKFARFYQCDADGLHDRTVFKGREPQLYRRLKKGGTNLPHRPERRAPPG